MTKSRKAKVPGTPENWESELLGADDASVEKAGADVNASVDKALGLQMISIRLDKELISILKAIASLRGVGYQPLIRDVLHRFANAESKQILLENAEDLLKSAKDGSSDKDCECDQKCA